MEKPLGFKKLMHDIRYRRHRFRQLLGIAVAILFTLTGKPVPVLFQAGAVIALIGVSIRLWASGHIKKDKALAVNGPYAYVRHPLYVGNIAGGFGLALAAGQWWWTIPVFIVFLLLFYPPAIQKEDKKLHRLFKEDWEEWRKNTRALIPNFRPSKENRSGKWSFIQSLRQNWEPVIALFVIMCLYWLFLKL